MGIAWRLNELGVWIVFDPDISPDALEIGGHDGREVPKTTDNRPAGANPTQAGTNGDRVRDACDN
jgi:hypothetical protein